jgi:uncharacterized protein (DUF1778 family)
MPKHKKKQNVFLPFVDFKMKAIKEAAKEHKSSVAYRYDLLKNYQAIAFKNEYDRLRGMLDRPRMDDSSIKRLTERKDKVKEMAKSKLYPIRGDH